MPGPLLPTGVSRMFTEVAIHIQRSIFPHLAKQAQRLSTSYMASYGSKVFADHDLSKCANSIMSAASAPVDTLFFIIWPITYLN